MDGVWWTWFGGGLGSAVQRTKDGCARVCVCVCKVRVIGNERGKEVVFLVEVVTSSLLLLWLFCCFVVYCIQVAVVLCYASEVW